jgi:hypothetical protein
VCLWWEIHIRVTYLYIELGGIAGVLLSMLGSTFGVGVYRCGLGHRVTVSWCGVLFGLTCGCSGVVCHNVFGCGELWSSKAGKVGLARFLTTCMLCTRTYSRLVKAFLSSKLMRSA